MTRPIIDAELRYMTTRSQTIATADLRDVISRVVDSLLRGHAVTWESGGMIYRTKFPEDHGPMLEGVSVVVAP